MSTKTSNMTRTIVGMGLLTAIVVVLQLIGSFIKLGMFSVSLVLMPIVIGAALYGYWAGAWLGLVFGIVVLLSGDAALFLGFNPFGTIVTVILKGAFAGLAAGFVYKLLAKSFKPENNSVIASEDRTLKALRIALGVFTLAGLFVMLFTPVCSAEEGSNNVLSMILFGRIADGSSFALAAFITFAVVSAVLFFIANITTTVAFNGYRSSGFVGIAASVSALTALLFAAVFFLSRDGANTVDLGWGFYAGVVISAVSAWLSVRLIGNKKAKAEDIEGKYSFRSNFPVLAASVVCPVVNTGLFIAGCYIFFFNNLKELSMGTPYGENVGSFIILGLVGFNFVFELAVNLILCPAIVSLIRTGEKSIARKA